MQTLNNDAYSGALLEMKLDRGSHRVLPGFIFDSLTRAVEVRVVGVGPSDTIIETDEVAPSFAFKVAAGAPKVVLRNLGFYGSGGDEPAISIVGGTVQILNCIVSNHSNGGAWHAPNPSATVRRTPHVLADSISQIHARF